MRKALLLVMLGLLAAAALPSVRAADPDKKFEVTGDFRVRFDRLENYFDLDDDTDDSFSFWPYRALIGVSGKLAENVNLVLQVQNFGAWGNQSPTQGITFPPNQTFDGDGIASGQRRSETSLYQAYVALNKIGGSNVNVWIGRQEYQIGDGLILGNEPFYNGTVYDGIKGFWSHGKWEATGFYYLTHESNDIGSTCTDLSDTSCALVARSDDQDLIGTVGSYKIGPEWGMVDGYLIRFSDRSEEAFRPRWFVLGGHWWREVKTKADAETCGWDWSTEIAVLRGRAFDSDTTERLDLAGYVTNDTVGYTFVAGRTLHRFFGNYIYQSGDDDTTDLDVDGWIPLFPTTHGRFGNADYFDTSFQFTNEASIWAGSLGYSLNLNGGTHMFGARVWKFGPAEDRVLFPGDASETKIDDYGTEYDLTYDYMYSRNTTLGFGIAVLNPGDGLRDVITGEDGPDDQITRAWGQIRVRF